MDKELAGEWVVFVKQLQSVVAVAMDNADLQKSLIGHWHVFVEMDLQRIIKNWTFEEEPDPG